MSSSPLFSPLVLKGKNAKNRLILPPMVRYFRENCDGFVEDADLAHYSAFAAGGFGTVIVEATCVDARGKLNPHQLGIWDDGFVPGLSAVAGVIHEYGAVALLQIHHAGLLSHTEQPLSASPCSCSFRGKDFSAREMSREEIAGIVDLFAAAARRAQLAGFDGVEIHGCHSYLLSQFLSSRVNQRTDEYGTQREKLVLEVFEAVRAAVGEDFIVGVRLGAFEPKLEDGIRHARLLAQAGADFLNISYGFALDHSPEKPEGYPFVEAVYGAQEIKKQVDVPVFAVNSIVSLPMAEHALELTGVDGICIGRGALVNPDWCSDAQAGRDTGRCFLCPVCHWRGDLPACPGRVELAGKRGG